MPSLLVDRIDNASLAWVVEVFVQEGAMQDGQDIQIWSLLVGRSVSGIKPSRVGDTQLHLTVEKADTETLELIREKLLTNQSLAGDRESIASANWVHRPMKVARL